MVDEESVKEQGFTLYAYVDGSDLQADERALVKAFESLIESRSWVCGIPSLVNQRHAADSSVGPGDTPDWDLGLNLSVHTVGNEPLGWFSDIQFIAERLSEMWLRTGRNFVIGIQDHDTGVVEDLYYVESNPPEIEHLQKIIGVEPPEA
nr:putative uncharacterized protein [uncultured bacterium]